MHSDDPADVPPEKEQQPEQSQRGSTNALPASKEQPERAHRGPTTSESAPPSFARPGLAAILTKTGRQKSRDDYVDREMGRQEMERKAANNIILKLEHRRSQISDAIRDTESWLTLEPTSEELGYVKPMLEMLSLWHQGLNEALSGLPLSDAHPHWLEYPETFLRLYRKASKAHGSAVGEHLAHLADVVSSELAANKAHEAQSVAIETWAAARKVATPLGQVTSWEQVEITFISDERVRVSTGSRMETLNYAEFGFDDRRDGKPNRAWITLRELAEKDGTISKPFGREHQWSMVEKRIEKIRELLRMHFQLDPNPLPFVRDRGYCALFKINVSPSSNA